MSAELPATAAETRAAVIGAGSWGTAFGRLLARAGVRTELICRLPAQAEAINRYRHNPEYLCEIELPASLTATSFGRNALPEADLTVVAVPSRVFREVMSALGGRIAPRSAVLSLTKGLEPGSLLRLSQVLAEILPAPAEERIAVLSGPNHAEEVSRDIPTATVIAARDPDLARRLQAMISTDSFRVYVNEDMIGVELCAAVKNVIALAAGMSDGLGFGDNTKASLVTRGLAEMARLGAAMGADPQTFAGLAGMGDLIATCTSRHSRNRRAGEMLARGRTPAAAEAEMGMVAEGITSAPSVLELSRRAGVEMPITGQVCAVLAGKDARLAVAELMTRAPRSEVER